MKSSFKKISIISIITFVGIFLMQAFWILDSYHERKAHFKEHINNVLDQISDNYCKEIATYHTELNNEKEHQIMDSILTHKFTQTDEMPSYLFIIQNQTKSDNTIEEFNSMEGDYFLFEQELNCENKAHKKLVLAIADDKYYFLGSILGWIILSSLLIIIGIIALFYNINFLRRQKKTSKIQSDFIGNMTHELKTPIATISVASEMLMKDRVLDDRTKSKRYSSIIYEENLRLKKLVERVMQIALFENGTMRIKLKEIDLHQSLDQSFEAIKMIIEKRNGSIHKELKATNFMYQVDVTHFSNIITNLLENAIKYSSDEPIINLSTSDYSEGILISISDKGIGIPKKYHERIFDRFFRVESGNIHNTQGFGLGLYYVRRVVEAHGGQIKVYSEEGKGSRFELYIPKLG